MVTSVNVFSIHPLKPLLSQLPCTITSQSLTCRLTSGWTVLKRGPRRVFFLPAWTDSGLRSHSLLTGCQHTFSLLFSGSTETTQSPSCAPGLFVERSCSAFQNTPPPQLEKPLQHKSILSDWLKRIWPLWLLSDHQKIVFTTTLSTTLTLTSSTPSMVVWAKSVQGRRQVWD